MLIATRASPFGLAQKIPKDQGLDLMSDKLVKAFRAATQVPDEKSGRTRCLGSEV
ncbi:hypothetical protein [Pedobacter changchengzhani]|uniref:hypothetical protein n=1 Tax=Pedobacter changchengzhani TaxID=2529274 RepID=UPI001404DA88|nr:hypothetical protein [Pedobacter changchengzhani]